MRLVAPVYKFNPRQERILEFKGYNRKTVIDDGEMRDMYNLSSDEFPCLSQRKPRAVYDEGFEHPTAMITKNKKLAVISNKQFSYDGVIYPSLKLSDETYMVPINSKICFFPEKKYFDVVIEDIGDMAAEESLEDVEVTITTSTLTFPSGNFSAKFFIGDAVQIKAKGEGTEDLNISAVIQAITATSITFPDETFISLIAEGETEKKITVDSITVDRSCPDLDFVMEAGNRLWGVSNKDNTIYACKLGDPTNWTYYQNTSLDSFYATQGTDGEWTGCAAYSKHLLFFKEDYIHKVYGSTPASYQIETAQCHALEKGSSKSVAIINETVLYKSRLGIMAYSGGVPMLISENFGTDIYTDAVAGTDGIKYVVSVLEGGEPRLLVYDMERFLWHKEDHMRARDFCYHDGRLLCINDDDNKIYEMIPSGEVEEKEPIEWMAELGPFDEFIEDKKVYSRLKMRLQLADLAELAVMISIDGGDWERIEHLNAEYDRAIVLPIVPRRCDKFAVRFEGKGRCRIESLVREYRQGTINGGVR